MLLTVGSHSNRFNQNDDMNQNRTLMDLLPTGKLAANSVQAIFGQILRAGVQGLNFILITRFLEAEQFGLFTASHALVLIVGCFAGLAFPHLLVIETSKAPKLAPNYFYRSLKFVLLTAPLLITIVFGLHIAIIDHQEMLLALLLLAISELLFFPLIDSCARVYQSFEQMRISTRLHNAPIYLRFFILAGHLSLSQELSILQVCTYYCLASGIASLFVVAWSIKTIGLDRTPVTGLSLQPGLLMGGSYLAHKSIQDVDKTVLAAIHTTQAAGIYSAGYRLVELAIIPARGVLETAYNRYMTAGNEGLSSSFNYSLRVLPWPIAYSIVVAVLLYLFSPAITWVLGDSFAESETVIQLFCVYPILFTVRQSLIQVLESSKLIFARASIYGLTALINLALTLWWVREHGWEGAIWATYVAELSLILFTLIYVVTQIKRGNQND